MGVEECQVLLVWTSSHELIKLQNFFVPASVIIVTTACHYQIPKCQFVHVRNFEYAFNVYEVIAFLDEKLNIMVFLIHFLANIHFEMSKLEK